MRIVGCCVVVVVAVVGATVGFARLARVFGVLVEVMAEQMGMTVDEYYAARQSGRSAAEIAEGRGFDLATVMATAFGDSPSRLFRHLEDVADPALFRSATTGWRTGDR